MPNTVALPPVVRQYTLGAAQKLDVPNGVIAARFFCASAWFYGDTVATAIFPGEVGVIDELPTAGLKDTYFAGSGTLLVAFFLG